MNYHSEKNQRIIGKFVERDVVACASTLVSELSKKADEFSDYYDDLISAYEGAYDFEQSAKDAGWKEKEGGGFVNENGEESEAESWEELCGEKVDYNIDYCAEVFEHWIITSWLADKLEEHGEKVLKDFFGFDIWCRTCTGQAILLDYVFGKICEELEILEGQKYEWIQ